MLLEACPMLNFKIHQKDPVEVRCTLKYGHPRYQSRHRVMFVRLVTPYREVEVARKTLRETTPSQSPTCSAMSIFMKGNTCFLMSLINTDTLSYKEYKVHFHPLSNHNRHVEYSYALSCSWGSTADFKKMYIAVSHTYS